MHIPKTQNSRSAAAKRKGRPLSADEQTLNPMLQVLRTTEKDLEATDTNLRDHWTALLTTTTTE